MPINYPPIITPEGKRTNKEGIEICGGRLRKREGHYCARRILNEYNRRCKFHGGNVLRGIASPSFEHGLRSKHFSSLMTALPQRMIAGVVQNLDDPQLLELRQEIAIVRERAADLMRRVDRGESGHLWKELKDTYRDLRSAQRVNDQATTQAAMEHLANLIERGTADYQGWEEISKQFDRKQRLSESERKREIEANQLAPADQTLLIIRNLLMAVRECVLDAEIRTAIQRRFSAILGESIEPRRYVTVIDGSGTGSAESVSENE